MSKYEIMRTKILDLSVSENYEEALKEWTETKRTFGHAKCLCTHKIKEICHVKNEFNGRKAVVGNCCIKKILRIDTGNFFSCIKRVLKDKYKTLNDDVINFMSANKDINILEKQFLESIKTMRFLDEDDEAKKLELNKRAIALYAQNAELEDSVVNCEYILTSNGLSCIFDVRGGQRIEICLSAYKKQNQAMIKSLLPKIDITRNEDLIFWLNRLNIQPQKIKWRLTEDLEGEIIEFKM